MDGVLTCWAKVHLVDVDAERVRSDLVGSHVEVIIRFPSKYDHRAVEDIIVAVLNKGPRRPQVPTRRPAVGVVVWVRQFG